MTSEGLTLPSRERQAQRPAGVVACAFCRRRLADEYFFTCRRCDEAYCYIHMSRHRPAQCGRRSGRKAPNPLIVAAGGRSRSSANV
jgi:hypothetical protein